MLLRPGQEKALWAPPTVPTEPWTGERTEPANPSSGTVSIENCSCYQTNSAQHETWDQKQGPEFSVRMYWDMDLTHCLCWNKEGTHHLLNTWPRDSLYQKQLKHSHWHPAGNQLNPHCPFLSPLSFLQNWPSRIRHPGHLEQISGWLALPQGSATQLKSPSTLSLGAAFCWDSVSWLQCPTSNKSP